VKGGSYSLARPLEFGPEDSGEPDAPIVYCRYDESPVTLRGSRPLSGWGPKGNGVWECRLPEDWAQTFQFTQVFYDGVRLPLARVPNRDAEHPRSGGFLYVDGVVEDGSKTLLRYNPEYLDPSGWASPTTAYVTVWSWLNWNLNRIPIKRIDTENHIIELAHGASYKFIRGNRYFIDNVPEELDAPGEWYLDRSRGVLSLIPPAGGSPEGHVTVDCLDSLVRFTGATDGSAEVSHIVFRGFALTESAGRLVEFSRAANCELVGCVLTNCGADAIRVVGASHHNRIAGCDISRCRGAGIEVSGIRDWTHTLEGRISHNIITNNHVHHVGEGGNAWAAIRISPGCGGNVTHDNIISHNLVHDTPRQGISFNGFRNIVEYNHVHHTNQEQSDTGAIGMGSRDIYERGSIIRYNYVHDTGGYCMVKPGVWEYPHYCWGIYLDDYTSGVHVYGNVCVRTYLGGVMVHGGQDNVIENNIIVDGHAYQLQLAPIDSLTSGRTKGHPDESMWLMTGTRILRNVFSYDGTRSDWIRGKKWEQVVAESDWNLIYPSGGPVKLNNLPDVDKEQSWTAWQAMGHDTHSVIADPLFVDAGADDYRLRRSSPAFDLGFQPIPFEKIGLYRSDERASWPVAEDCWRETHLTHPEGLSATTPGGGRAGGAAPVLRCPRVDTPPEIDGNISSGEWPGAGVNVAALSMGDGVGRQPSTVFVAHDDQALYVGLLNQVSNAAALKKEDGVWGADDGAEVCIQVCPEEGKPGPIFVIQGYPSGKCESVTNAGAPASAAKALGKAVSYGAGIQGAGWTGEWRIPFDALGIRPGAKPVVGFNIGVLKAAETQWIAWVSAGGAPWHMERAGTLKLED
jgi:hypothetical protein